MNVDSSLLKDTGLQCYMGINNAISSEDCDTLKSLYSEHPFMTVEKVSEDTVQQKQVKKMQLLNNDAKLQ